MLNDNIHIELKLSRKKYSTISECVFYSGFLRHSFRPNEGTDILIRSNLPNNHLFVCGDKKSIVMDRKWCEHAYTIINLMHTWDHFSTIDQPSELDLIQATMQKSYLGMICCISIDSLAEENERELHFANILAKKYSNEIRFYEQFQEESLQENDPGTTICWAAATLPSIAYFHELGHFYHDGKSDVFYEIVEFLNDLSSRVCELIRERAYQIDGSRFDRTGDSISHLTWFNSSSYDEVVSASWSLLLGLQDEIIFKEIFADIFMMRTVYGIFSEKIREERRFQYYYGADVYITGLFLYFIEINNSISSIPQFAQRKSYGENAEEDARSSFFNINQATSRQAVVVHYMRYLVKHSYDTKHKSNLLWTPTSEYPIEVFTLEVEEMLREMSSTIKNLHKLFLNEFGTGADLP